MQELIGLTMMQLQDDGPRYWDLGADDEEGIFADLLALVVRTRLELQRRHVEDPRSLLSFATWGITMGEPHLKTDNANRLLLETHGCSLLPFKVETAVAACWRMFSLSHMKDLATFSNDVLARSFTCSSSHFGRQIDVRGKHTCRKYTLPRFRYGHSDQNQRAREVIDWVSRSHHMVHDWYRQKLSEILVEEDWKAFCGDGEMSVEVD
ncbi:hypothetical protein PHMEG_00010776 [Phytophthora megakarya]|uniref:Uncharacterized protein n=1 Tax=Phytophthora megakarya TaxID=4795 RepID=A0A225WEK8_9STRA|nr:hypothetical protein PHMEG_00010776 [Phytophthora megakarya]